MIPSDEVVPRATLVAGFGTLMLITLGIGVLIATATTAHFRIGSTPDRQLEPSSSLVIPAANYSSGGSAGAGLITVGFDEAGAATAELVTVNGAQVAPLREELVPGARRDVAHQP
ncbi:MAG: hypothetical protein EXR58_08875 [Chloroflexi bacterium]|nr:hypothetical protein [Chloroflexota bacterium]